MAQRKQKGRKTPG